MYFRRSDKTYNFVDKKEWKERGLGVLRLNVTEPQSDDGDSTLKARLVMRADGSHRVILMLYREAKIGNRGSDYPCESMPSAGCQQRCISRPHALAERMPE